MDLDRKRRAAVRALEALGYTYRKDEWSPAAVTVVPVPLTAEAPTPCAPNLCGEQMRWLVARNPR